MRRPLFLVPAVAAALLGSLAGAPSAAAAARPVTPACAASPDADFADTVTLAADLRDAIGCLGSHGVTLGNADGTYRPFETITRAQMALFLFRELEWFSQTNELVYAPYPDGSRGPFTDIHSLSDDAYEAIVGLAQVGVVAGKSESTYAPHDPVTRRDMATFIVRVQDFVAEQMGQDVGYSGRGGSGTFPDVPADLPRAADIEALVAAEVVVGGTDGTYRPFDDVTRGQMAFFIARHLAENVVSGRTLPAEPGADVVRNITTVTRYDDLSDAVDAAAELDGLLLQGEFTESAPVVIDVPLYLGTYEDLAVLHGSVVVAADDVFVAGLAVDDFVPHEGRLAAFYLSGVQGAFVAGNEIIGDGEGAGVVTSGTVDAQLIGNLIEGTATGVLVAEGARVDIFDNVIAGTGAGIELRGVGSVVEANYFEENAAHVVDATPDAYDLDAVVTDNAFAAVDAGGSVEVVGTSPRSVVDVVG